MKLHALGINYAHNGSFSINRPQGSGDNLLLIFKTEAAVTLNGQRMTVSPDSALLYRRGTPQIYGASGESYVNHWIHFHCGSEDELSWETGILFNTVFAADEVSSAEEIMSMLGRENLSQGSERERCEELLLMLLMNKLGGCCRRSMSGRNFPVMRYDPELERLRAEMYSSPSSKLTVADMAQRLNVSPSHFQTIYRKRFGVSCYEDLLRARIRAAEHYLKTTDMTVREIAEICGYDNDVHFMRQYKKRTGHTPSEVRKTPVSK